MLVIGHRGAAGTHPENTLLSVAHALEVGADWVEIDVRMVDNTIIVLHDDTLDRTTNGSGSLYRHSLSELREFDAGGGEQIPLLSEVMDLIGARAVLNIEIKQVGIAAPLLDLIKSCIARQPNWQHRIMLSSFLPGVMREIAELAPAGCLLGVLSEGRAAESMALATDIDAYSINLSRDQLSAAAVRRAHERGLKALVYTVNATVEMARCLDCSVDGIFTDFPERAIAFLRKSPMIPKT